MTTVVIIFMIIAAIFALSSLGYVGYDIWKEVRAKKAQTEQTHAEGLQDEAQGQETEDTCEKAEIVEAE